MLLLVLLGNIQLTIKTESNAAVHMTGITCVKACYFNTRFFFLPPSEQASRAVNRAGGCNKQPGRARQASDGAALGASRTALEKDFKQEEIDLHREEMAITAVLKQKEAF